MPTTTQPIPTWYKPSPLWPIPQDWEVISLWEIWETYSWLSWKSKEDFWEGSPYIPYMNIFSNPVIKDGNFDFVKINEWENQHKVENWDIFFTTSSETPEEVWMCSSYWWNNNNLYLNSFCFWIRFKEKNKYSPIFLSNFFRSNFWRKIMYKLAQWATRYNLSKQWLLKQEFWIPKIEEQTAIATILSTVDTTIQQTQEIIKKLEIRNKGLQQKLLTGKVRIKGVMWKFKKLNADEIFRPISIKNLPNEQLLSATQDQWIIPRDMLEWRVTMPTTEAKSYKLVVPWNFIISLRSFQWWLEYSEYRWIVSPAYTVLEPIVSIDDDFYKYYFKSYDFIGHLAVAVIWIRDWKQISFDNFCTLDLPYPDIEEQKAIANLLNKANQEINQYKQKLEKLQTLKNGLMQQLLTGKVRVKEFRK